MKKLISLLLVLALSLGMIAALAEDFDPAQLLDWYDEHPEVVAGADEVGYAVYDPEQGALRVGEFDIGHHTVHQGLAAGEEPRGVAAVYVVAGEYEIVHRGILAHEVIPHRKGHRHEGEVYPVSFFHYSRVVPIS